MNNNILNPYKGGYMKMTQETQEIIDMILEIQSNDAETKHQIIEMLLEIKNLEQSIKENKGNVQKDKRMLRQKFEEIKELIFSL